MARIFRKASALRSENSCKTRHVCGRCRSLSGRMSFPPMVELGGLEAGERLRAAVTSWMAVYRSNMWLRVYNPGARMELRKIPSDRRTMSE